MKIDDIARLANVSKSAVSLALNGKPGVSEETRKIILDIVEEYNYIPLRKTRKKEPQATKILKFVACKNNDIVTEDYQSLPFFSQLIGSLVEETKRHGYALLLSTIDISSISQDLIDLEAEQPSDAIILLGTNLSEEQISEIKAIQNNLVVLDTCVPNMDADFITMNNFQGAYTAAEYIARNGHQSIGYAMSEARIYNFEERRRGFCAGLEKAGLKMLDKHILKFPGMKIEDQSEKFQYLKNEKELPTVYFCEDDYIAVSLIKTLLNLGISVPEDVSVIGFDDIPEAKVIAPELTTIHVPKRQIAYCSLNAVTEILKGEKVFNSHLLISTQLIERNSFASLL